MRLIVSALGARNTLRFLVQRRRLKMSGRPRSLTFWTPMAAHPLAARAGTSDLDVFHQVFIERQYEHVNDLEGVGLVIDGGANVGYSSAYFLSRFPDAEVIAVEPDDGNFATLCQNLRPYADRVTALRAALWSDSAGLVMDETPYADGREWTRHVREPRRGERPDIEGIEVGALLDRSPYDRISLLKLDVEGAEAVIFGRSDASWLERVDNIVIELHTNSPYGDGTAAFRRAIDGRGFAMSRRGDLTFAARGAAARLGSRSS